MPSKIISFGYRHGDIPQGEVVIDVRNMFRNPYWNRALRFKNGLDAAVQQDIMTTPNFDALYQHLKQQVAVPGPDTVYIGCTGGHHRSVFLAEKLGKELGLEVFHRDLHKP